MPWLPEQEKQTENGNLIHRGIKQEHNSCSPFTSVMFLFQFMLLFRLQRLVQLDRLTFCIFSRIDASQVDIRSKAKHDTRHKSYMIRCNKTMSHLNVFNGLTGIHRRTN